MWVFPLYLLLINIFVFPLALAGKMFFDKSINPDTYVLSLPLSQGWDWLALFAFIGGFSAAMSMVVVEATALSIMFSNHIVVPLLIKSRGFYLDTDKVDGATRLLDIRRISILLMLLLAYLYQRTVGSTYDLVSVGLISFTGQILSSVGAFHDWGHVLETRHASGRYYRTDFRLRRLWAYCLPVPSLAKAQIIPDYFVTHGLWGIEWLKPYELFGMSGLDPISHAAFWSLTINGLLYAIVSVNTKPNTLDLTQADLFVNIEKYIGGQEADILKREAKIQDLRELLNRFLGESRTVAMFQEYEFQHGISINDQKLAQADLVNFAETHLAGAIGAASARLVMDSVVKEETLSLDEVMRILEQTKEADGTQQINGSQKSRTQRVGPATDYGKRTTKNIRPP